MSSEARDKVKIEGGKKQAEVGSGSGRVRSVDVANFQVDFASGDWNVHRVIVDRLHDEIGVHATVVVCARSGHRVDCGGMDGVLPGGPVLLGMEVGVGRRGRWRGRSGGLLLLEVPDVRDCGGGRRRDVVVLACSDGGYNHLARDDIG